MSCSGVYKTSQFQCGNGVSPVPCPMNRYTGSLKNKRYTHLGSYVPAARYTQLGCNGYGGQAFLDGRINKQQYPKSYAAYSKRNKIQHPNVDASFGLSSSDLMFPGPMDATNHMFRGQVTCNPCRIDQTCHPFNDTVIDEPRDLAYINALRGDSTFITTNFNQSKDLRGSIAVPTYGGTPIGAKVATHGAFGATKRYRPYVY